MGFYVVRGDDRLGWWRTRPEAEKYAREANYRRSTSDYDASVTPDATEAAREQEK